MSPESDQPMTHEIGRRTYVVADVDPLDVDGTRTVAVGTALWLVGFVGLLPFYGRLSDDGHLWWLWTCLAGFGLGLTGWDYCRRRRKARLEKESRPGHEEVPESATPGPPAYDAGPVGGKRRASVPEDTHDTHDTEDAGATGSDDRPVRVPADTVRDEQEHEAVPETGSSDATRQKPPFAPPGRRTS